MAFVFVCLWNLCVRENVWMSGYSVCLWKECVRVFICVCDCVCANFWCVCLCKWNLCEGLTPGAFQWELLQIASHNFAGFPTFILRL